MSCRPCNYCQFQNLRRQAANNGLILETRPDNFGLPDFAPEGVSVYMRKLDEMLDTSRDGEHFIVWFANVTSKCVC